MARMDDNELRAIVDAKLTGALGYQGGVLSQERLFAYQYYKGEPRGDEQDGRSKVTSRDVAEAVDGMIPPLLKPFTSTELIASFEPVYRSPGPGETPLMAAKRQEQIAKVATERVSYEFFKKNEGFRILHDWLKDGLLQKLGILKVWWDDSTDTTTEHYENLTDAELHVLQQDVDIEVVDIKEKADPEAPANVVLLSALSTGQMPRVFDVTCRRTKNTSQVRVMVVPPDEFLIDHRSVTLEEAPFLCHRAKLTITEIKQMFPDVDPEVIDGLPGNDAVGDFNQERIERFKDEDAYPYRYDTPADPSTREVWLNECYVRVDYDGDGFAELRQVWLGGDSNTTILGNCEADDHPFIGFTPVPMPHKVFGMSIADQTMELQDIKTTLWRSALDSLYVGVEPMIGVVDGQVNLDDLLNRRAGGIVRLKSADALVPMPSINVSQDAFTMMSYVDSVREERTGVRRFSSTIDADSANTFQATATGAKLMDDAANDRLQLIAKIWAEEGIRPLAKRMLELLCKNSKRQEVIRMNGKFVPMDPREWSDQMDVTISVGLGTDNRDQRMQKLAGLGNIYQQLVQLQQGLNGPLVKAENVYGWLMEMLRAAKEPMPELFFTDPTTMPPPPPGQPQQDPKLLESQAKIQQGAAQSQQQLQAQQARAQTDIAIANAKAKNDMMIEELKAKHAMDLERLQAYEQMERDRAELASKHQQGMEQARASTRKVVGVDLTHGPDGFVVAARKRYDDGTHEHVPVTRNQSGASQ